MVSVRGLDPELPVVRTLADGVIDHLFHPLRVGIWERLEPKGVLLRLLQLCQQVVSPPDVLVHAAAPEAHLQTTAAVAIRHGC